MSKLNQIFVNLPVRDLNKTMDFWKALGFTFNPQFTDQNAACLELSGKDGAFYAMLLTREFFAKFTQKSIADAANTVETINALFVDSREAVDELIQKARAAGARQYRAVDDYGWMYSNNFEDPDGHQWEVGWMDMAKAPQNPGEMESQPDFRPPQS